MKEAARVERFLSLLRETHPSFERIFTEGGCYHLFLILRSLWPQAELWYAHVPGHVYVRIDGVFFDIRGGRRAVPEGAMPTTVRDLRRPDRWRKQMLWQENARLVA